ncbi:hypothetical protein UlMin_033846 [Ulmus minor]
MGSCLSSISSSRLASHQSSSSWTSTSSSAKVISLKGDLQEYPAPVVASDVLSNENENQSDLFVCNSDCLYFDELIPALHSEQPLQPNRIYFVLPSSMLQRSLSASDMASLAVKASTAIKNYDTNLFNNKKKKKARISPLSSSAKTSNRMNIIIPPEYKYDYESTVGASRKKKSPALGIQRSGSVRKLQRYTSKRAKMAVRSFRLRLTTIYEGTVL